ncbi:antitoxin Xre/MbcA/ParS toxin-binding domain-containing protein [Oceanicella sp. SM1341]|uniref:antitoxin Xre/MbcA/ParS toxin-binding domain-containing protein n=1 Tax=Oceanicella sp. SM1341 TaxID=1548889 RepID=UPI000E4E0C04|nr:antitoxin Xre/MbcA/ParS toxin-binding domain-containing protein [Oceanicella sp. SM1341]
MAFPLVHPATNHEPAPLVDLGDAQERARLSDGAVRAFLNIMERWGVRDEDARRLLGGLSNGAFYTLKKGGGRALDEDRLRRISYLVGIFKALNILHGEALADRWMSLPNRNRIFAGATPLDYLLRGGLPAFATLRRLLDARRGGA